MIPLEIQQALNKKVESWEYHDMKNQIDNLRRLNNELQDKISRHEGKIENLNSVIRDIIDAIQNENQEGYHFTLDNIKNQLY